MCLSSVANENEFDCPVLGRISIPIDNGGMIYRNPPFPHHLLQVPVTEGIAALLSHIQQDNVCPKMTPFEQRWSGHWKKINHGETFLPYRLFQFLRQTGMPRGHNEG